MLRFLLFVLLFGFLLFIFFFFLWDFSPSFSWKFLFFSFFIFFFFIFFCYPGFPFFFMDSIYQYLWKLLLQDVFVSMESIKLLNNLVDIVNFQNFLLFDSFRFERFPEREILVVEFFKELEALRIYSFTNCLWFLLFFLCFVFLLSLIFFVLQKEDFAVFLIIFGFLCAIFTFLYFFFFDYPVFMDLEDYCFINHEFSKNVFVGKDSIRYYNDLAAFVNSEYASRQFEILAEDAKISVSDFVVISSELEAYFLKGVNHKVLLLL